MKSITPIILLAVLILGLGSSSIYTVYETDQAILLRLGKIVTTKDDKPLVVGPGLHVKIPFIDNVKKFDIRLNMLDIRPQPVVTIEKKTVEVDLFVQWKIDDLALFYTRNLGNKMRAEDLLEQKVIDGLRAEFGKRTIKEVISGERVSLMDTLRKRTDQSANQLGISVIDVRIKRIEFPQDVREAVYARMRAERHRVASEIKATGAAEAIEIIAKAKKEKLVLLALAKKDAETTKGEGDAKSIEISAKNYSKSPDLYEFHRSLEAYKNVFKDKSDLILLKPDGEFFKFFHSKEGK
jgi:modulator of FtsH protease HflC